MRVLLDCSHIATGGAIQNSLAVLHHARLCARHEWHVIMTRTLSRQFPESGDTDFASVRRLEHWGTLRTRFAVHLAMPRWERSLVPDVCFTPGGPVYWRSRARQLVSFALPHLIYPEIDLFAGLNFHDRWDLRLRLRAARESFLKADALIVQTETVRDRVARFLPFQRHRIFVVKNSFSSVFETAVRAAPPRRATDRFSILVPSAYYRHKNLGCVIDVARELRQRGLSNAEFRLTLPAESRASRDLLAGAKAAGVASMVRILGNVPHSALAAQYRDSDLIFLPTLLECSTAVYPESFIAGVPLVTSDRDFARDLCGDGARYVDPLRPSDMADVLAELINSNVERAKLINAGRVALAMRYISPEQKWADQLAIIEARG